MMQGEVMKIVVCVRQGSDGEISPFDACAYEEALKVKGASVTLLSMGPPKTKDFLSGLTRLGAERAVLLCDNAFAGADTLATSYTLSLAIKKLAPDLVLCGRKTVDGDTAQVGPELSVMCGLPLVTEVMSLDCKENEFSCTDRENNEHTMPYPALLTVERINTLRLPSIRSKTSPVTVLTAAELGADTSKTGLAGSPTKVIKTFENDTDRRHCEFVSVESLNKIIHESLKKDTVYSEQSKCETPLKKVWCVGDAPCEMGETVSDDITVIPLLSADEICERIKNEKPNAVLWGSDSISKRIAASVAAKLKIGLCADCVSLETDGKDLFMYRPAFSGSIIAKIRSTSFVKMATVRTSEPEQKDVIIGVGMGAKDNLQIAESLAKKYGGELAATRPMVDRDCMPYSMQVGLTGKTVSPKVYIALGISGAVHHIAGIRKSGVIIAVNSDKNAPIFNYADYGIVTEIKNIL